MKDKYAYSTNSENYNGSFDSREEAIAEARASGLDVFWTGKCVAPCRSINAQNVIDDVACSTTEETGDWSDGYLDHVPKDAIEELEKDLQIVWDKWEKKHGLEPEWFNIEEVEYHNFEL